MRRSCALRRLTPTAIILALAGCGSDEPPPPGHTVRDSAGIEIVENVGTDDRTTLSVRETLRLGILEGGGPEQFSEVYSVATDDQGRIYVGNNASGSVRVFNGDGRFLVEFGGRGEGPAEVSMINDVIVADTTVAVVDWQRGGKAVLFHRDGRFIDTWTIGYSERRVMPQAFSDNGWIGLTGSDRPPALDVGESWRPRRSIYLMDFGTAPEGEPVHEFPDVTLYGVERAEMGVDWGIIPERPHIAFDRAGRLFITDPWEYRIDVVSGRDVVRSVRRNTTPRPLTGEDIEEITAAAVQVIDTLSLIRSESSRAEQRRQLIDRLEQQSRLPGPETVPPLGSILASPDGSFWVERLDAQPASYTVLAFWGMFDRVPPVETRWDLFDADGMLRGSVELPARFRAKAVDGREVVGVWRDDLDVEYVVRYEVDP